VKILLHLKASNSLSFLVKFVTHDKYLILCDVNGFSKTIKFF
jgi:hypothetical protein